MDGASASRKSHEEKENLLKDSVNKSESRKAVITFERTVSAAVDGEKRLQNSGGGKNGKNIRKSKDKQCKRERPRSADLSWKCLVEKCRRTRPRSSEALSEEEELESRGPELGGGRPWRRPEGPGSCCCSSISWEESFAWLQGNHRRRCCSFTHCCPHSDTILREHPFHLPRNCKSSCHFSKGIFQKYDKTSERDFQKVQRSLRLLGFQPSDFGVLTGRTETTPKWKPKRPSPTLSTKISRRSISLDSLRVEVRRAWLDDRLDETHRRLLAQAAYEEWYFTKERELREKREEERTKQLNTKLKLKDDFQRKKEKSEKEFQKWLSRKTTKRKGRETVLVLKHELMETKERSEKAFLNWKKTKDREMEKIKMEKRKEEEKKIEKEKQKAERKIIAEKAFQQWKKKLEENEQKRDTKLQREKRKQEIEERRKRAEGSQISFQMWKEAKDKQIKEKLKQYRENNRTEREERCAQMEERLYEAEQAFEDWLEKVDLRKEKQCYSMTSYQKIIPWIPV